MHIFLRKNVNVFLRGKNRFNCTFLLHSSMKDKKHLKEETNMATNQWKKAAALLSVGAMATSLFTVPMTVQAEEEPITINFSFDQGVGEPTQQIVDAYNESQDAVRVETVILPQDANTVHDDFVNK